MAQEDGFLSRWSRRKVQDAQNTRAPQEAREQTPPARAQPPLPPPTGPLPGHARPNAVQPSAQGSGAAAAAGAQAAPAQGQTPPGTDQPEHPAPPPPTLEEAQQLTPEADFTRFVGRDVDPQVKNAALKNLFSDPQFNVMDGLDIYIDDYGRPDPLPPGMLERMTQSTLLGLFRKTPEEEAAAQVEQAEAGDTAEATETAAPAAGPSGSAPPPDATGLPNDLAPAEAEAPHPVSTAPTDPQDAAPHEDPDLRLQRHDDAGRSGPGQGPEPDPGRQR